MNVYNQYESQTYQVKARIITTKEYNVVKRQRTLNYIDLSCKI